MELYSKFESIKTTTSQCKKLLKEGLEGLIITHINICSLNKHFEELLIMIAELDELPDVIICTETWQVNEKMYIIPGYQVSYNNGHLNKNDGVITYVKNGLQNEHTTEKIGEVTLNINKINKADTQYEIYAIYKSPAIKISEFNENLENFLHARNQNSQAEQILIGDLNIDLLDHSLTTTEYSNTLAAYGFFPTIETPTRITTTTSTCIDHCFIKPHKAIEHLISIIIETTITDHYPITIKISTSNKKKKENTSIKPTKINFKKLRNATLNNDFSEIYSCYEADYCAELFTKILQKTIDQSQTQINCSSKNKQPWITSKIVRLINKRDNLHKKARRTKNPADIEAHRKYRNDLTATIKKARYEYYTKRIQNNKADQKNIWNVVNDFMQRKNNQKNESTELTKEDGTKTKNKKDRANYFNDYFVNVGKNLATKLKNKKFSSRNISRVTDTFYLHPVSEMEVYKEIMNLKDSKSPGHDNINSKCLKSIADLISEPLAHIINVGFGTGKFPKIFKKAVIKAIYKAGKRDEVGNYRPISLITNLAKIMEKCLYRRLIRFINEHNIINKKQFGFRQNKSTEDALSEFVTKIYDNIDKKIPTLSIFIDLAKAFDTLDHEILLKKLELLGIRGLSHSLIKNYLEEREQIVKIENTFSEPKIMEYGVPQGTVIGPLLFILYLNDLYNINSSGKILSFADDTSIIFENETWDKLKEEVEEEIPIIYEWFTNNSLTVNVNKTQVMLYGSQKTSIPPWNEITFKYEKQTLKIQVTEKAKYLGVIVDSHLRWDHHIISLSNKLRYSPFVFAKLKNIFHENILSSSLYHALFYSILRYGILVWGGTNKTTIRQVEIVQKRVLKIILNKPRRYPTELLFQESKHLSIKETFALKAITYLITEGIKNEPIIDTRRTTRQITSQQIRVPARRKAIGQKTYEYIGLKIINSMPATLRIKLVNYEAKNKKLVTAEIINWLKTINIESILKN